MVISALRSARGAAPVFDRERIDGALVAAVGQIEDGGRPGPAIVAVHHRRGDEAHLVRLGGDVGERERLHAAGGQPAVDEADVLEADVEAERPRPSPADQIAIAAGKRPKRRMMFAASAAASVWTWAPLQAVVSWRTSRTQRGFFAAFVLPLGGDRERVVRRDQAEHVPRSRSPSFTSSAASPSLSATRTASAVAMPVPISTACEESVMRPAGSSLDQREGRVGAAAVHHGHAGEADAVELVRRRRGAARLLGGAPGPDRLRRQPVEHLAAPHVPEMTLPTMVLPPFASRLRLRNSTGSRPRLAAASSIITSSAVMVCNAPKPRIEPAVTARLCRATVVHVDLRHVVHADRRGGADERDRRRRDWRGRRRRDPGRRRRR